MPKGPPPDDTSGMRRPVSGTVTYLERALWRQLAEATTAKEFCQAWLGLQSRMIGGVTGGVVVLERAETGSLAPAAVWPQDFAETERLRSAVERTLREGKGVLTRGETDAASETGGEAVFQLAYPILIDDEARGVAALLITPRPQTQFQSAMRQLQWGAAWLQNWVLRDEAAPRTSEKKRLTTALEVAALALEEERYHGAATAAVTDLATRMNCDRVSIGFVEGNQVKVHALSHSSQFVKRMNLIRSIGMAMGESVDQQAVLVYPEPEQAQHRVLHAHEQLVRAHGTAAVCTVPFLQRDGSPGGALTFERAVAEPFDAETVTLCDSVASLLGPILDEKRKNDRLLVRKVGDSLRTQLRRLFGPRYLLRKVLTVGFLALAAVLIFAKGNHRVTADIVLEGEVRRVVSAPFRGFVFEAPARGGDVVEAGEVLCSLDVRDLRLEQSRLSSERERYQLEHRKAMAIGDRAAAGVLSKRMRQAEAQIDLLDEQITRARIVAPFDGVVVSGDLSQSLGAPVDAGQVLFEVAPLESYRVMLRVDERDIGDVQVGQSGDLILTAMPHERIDFTVTKVTPVSVAEEGRNYFVAEGALGQISETLRPGMEGFGKIHVGRRRLIWIWSHDLVDWVRLRSWTWLP